MLNPASQNTAIADAVPGWARALTPGDEGCGMAGPSRDNALDHAVVVMSGNRSGYRVPAIIMSPRVAEGEVWGSR